MSKLDIYKASNGSIEFKSGELEKSAVVAIFATTANDGKSYQVEYYNLDVIISIRYRVDSKEATQFRIWATKVLSEYIYHGYAINSAKITLKTSNNYHDRFLIIDKTEAYHIGASLKDLGKKVFAFSQIDIQMLRFGDE
ncbi:MAG: hypothetical protein GQ582_03405 [Methyloprofundus sp.]|nr:hypothetical protein [Methyloprofundus sp.]